MKLFQYRLYDNNRNYREGYIAAKGAREAKNNLKEIFSLKSSTQARVFHMWAANDTKTGFFIFDDNNKEIFRR